MNKYRVENKYIVSETDLKLLDARLRSFLSYDSNQNGACYTVRSLYFDDARDRCMDENEAGVDSREKYRFRHYGPDTMDIKLEIKEKYRGYILKSGCLISRDECLNVMNGQFPVCCSNRKEWNALSIRMRTELMRPKVIISYERTAFVYPAGNVRITFDRNISASSCCEDFLNPFVSKSIPILPVGMHVLEVKYDEFLPDMIAQLLELGNLKQTAFSKYYLGRLAVRGEFPVI